MKPNLRMVVATDLGPAGDLALSAATTWARRHDGGGVVLHIARGDAREAALDERIRAIAGELAPRFEQRIERGNTADRILEVARGTRADLIVLGGRDEEHSRWRFGSVAQRVVTHSEIPVLVARAHAETGRVLAVSDLSEASLVAIAPAREIARAVGSRATVVHCVEPSIPHEETLEDLARDPELTARAVRREVTERLRALAGDGVDVEVVVGSVVPTLIEAAEAHDAEVVVTASRGRTGISRFFLGSVAGALVREIHRSVLVVQRR